MNKLKELFDNSCVVSCTTMTSELTSAAELDGLIPDQTNYHLLSTLYTDSSYLKNWQLLAEIVQKGFCKNKIIDIMLPLQIEINSKRSVELVRVLLHRRRVLGIRMRARQKQQRGRAFLYDIPDPLRKLTDNSQCPIGEFYLIFENTKVAPIFESELSSDLLLLYHCYGCELFTISGDISEDKKPLQFDARQKLKNFCASKKRAAIYCAALGSPTPTMLFSGQSFICLCDKTLSKSSISVFQKSEVQSGYLNLNQVKESVNYDQILMEDSSYDLVAVEVNYILKRKNFQVIPPENFIKSHQPIVLREIPKYYLWYIFKKYNKSTAFYVSSLLTEHNLTLIHLIDRIANEISNRQIPAFEGENTYSNVLARMLCVCDYSLTTDFDLNKNEVLGRVRKALEMNSRFIKGKTKATSTDAIYEYYLELIASQVKNGGRICLYSNIPAQISVIGKVIENNPTADIVLYNNIARHLECDKVINLRLHYHIIEIELGSEDYTRSQHQKVEELLEQSKGNLLCFLAKMLKAFGDIELQKLDTKLIPSVVRKHAKNDELTDYYLNTPTTVRCIRLNELLSQAEHAEQQFFVQNKEIHITSHLKTIETKHRDNQFHPNGGIQDKLERIRTIKNTKYYNCHMCEKPYPRILGELCQCSTFHCLDCLKRTTPGDQKVVPKCTYCLNKCTCKKCRLQKEKRQKENILTECHYCNESRSMFVVCSKVTCGVSYCHECYYKYSGGQHVSILSLKSWLCFVCQQTCPCLMCRIRLQKKIMTSQQITISTGTATPQIKALQKSNNQNLSVNLGIATGLMTGLQKPTSSPLHQSDIISKYTQLDQSNYVQKSTFNRQDSFIKNTQQTNQHSDADKNQKAEKDSNRYAPTFISKTEIDISPKRGRYQPKRNREGQGNRNRDGQGTRRGDDESSFNNNKFQRRQRPNRDNDKDRSGSDEERKRGRKQNNRSRSRSKERQISKDRSRSRDKGLNQHKPTTSEAPLWGASTTHQGNSRSNNSLRNDKKGGYQNKQHSNQDDSEQKQFTVKISSSKADVDIDY